MVLLQRLPMVPTRDCMEIDDARFPSRRAVRTFNNMCSLRGILLSRLPVPYLSMAAT